MKSAPTVSKYSAFMSCFHHQEKREEIKECVCCRAATTDDSNEREDDLLHPIAKKLLKVQPPRCAGCLYGSMTRRRWTDFPRNNRSGLRTANRPGDIVSVDQLESTTPGFIAHLRGNLTKNRYTAATIYVDHHSRLSYVHLQRALTSAETVEGKIAFENYCANRGVRVKHYHADNGRFQDKLFMKDIRDKHQNISFCGVNAQIFGHMLYVQRMIK